MYLNHIDIRNFRCFKKYSVDFSPRITILYGLNGAGKTTLIHAIHKALSFVMATDTSGDKKVRHTIAGGNTKLKVENFSANGDFFLMEDEKDIDPVMEVGAMASLEGETSIEWAISAYTNKGKARPSAYMPAFKKFYEQYELTDKLPVLAYYSDGFPHVEDKRVVSEKMASLRSMGYYDWNNEEACSKIWLERLEWKMRFVERTERRLKEYDKYSHIEDASIVISNQEMYDKELKELNEVKHELEAINNCFKCFSLGDAYIEVEALELGAFDDQLSLRTTQKKIFSFRNLPAGYKRMYYMLLDIAYRSYILNRTVDAEGIVMIDEIDLHLHPGLEKVVLQRFAKVFPHLQFIVSTHSPLVITSVETEKTGNKIYCMVPNQTEPFLMSDVYGLDYNTSIEDVMHVEASNEELEQKVALCAYMMREGLLEQAGNLRENILQEHGISQERLERMIAKCKEEMEHEIH